ncbi:MULTISPECIES: SDR family NAD(P)-dependent oxidoreductase [unclassified Actinomyces]|uniref:SDR family NAD(P)-dependent oxidoreductase n=1 Tax=unclassified Actinomyces TaxID=2609248 RepID=UPI000D597C2D|nr:MULTISPECIES: SDR family NAD(P)-dependent oxidoreductase [unclassified Actinomyces]RAX19479.1 SDR family NAD(P)-dependent oxidoreductase [Actinomyces sp. Z5]RAX23253.1 SDR family NAD(P)-dependent oxidoreductase [Actinomyces sp. Z3]
MEAQMLKGQVALITGASYGMGRTMAELFAEEGAAVAVTARHAEQLDEVVQAIRAKGGRAIGVVADVTSLEDTERVFARVLEEFGDLDILINNAGIGEQKTIDDTDDDWMLYVMNTNLAGPMRYIREALKIFRPKNAGCIINISSVNGERPFCGAAYTSTKGGLNTLTKNVAMLLNDTDIRCNAVAPGSTVTPAHLANKAGEQPGGQKMLEHSQHYVYFPGPECDPMDQAYACLYLASKMGRAVRGQVIQVCNGAFL